jgi:hypothetical protein
MAGASYPRTGGTWLSPRSRAAARALWRDGVRLIDPAAYTDLDAASDEVRQAHDAFCAANLPPDFLTFALADADKREITDYPGAVPGLTPSPTSDLIGATREFAAAQLGLSDAALTEVLGTFQGDVTLIQLQPNTQIFRTVGRMCRQPEVSRGAVTNALLGACWDLRSPNAYESRQTWRARMAVLAEWTGDLGHVAPVLAVSRWGLIGTVAPQAIPRTGAPMYLPGGGTQVYLPHLANQHLREPLLGRPLGDVIHQTRFGSQT